MRRTLAALSFGVILVAQASDVPRPAPDFAFALPDGKQVSLAELKGKVVAVEFLSTTCPHCQASAQVLTRLQKEYGPKGFQAVGAAFNPMASMLVPDFVRNFQVGFPIGSTTRDAVAAFMQHDPNFQIFVPQVVFLDRRGNIRAQTPPQSDEKLTQEAGMRAMIEDLLKEPAPAPMRPPNRKSSKRPS